MNLGRAVVLGRVGPALAFFLSADRVTDAIHQWCGARGAIQT